MKTIQTRFPKKRGKFNLVVTEHIPYPVWITVHGPIPWQNIMYLLFNLRMRGVGLHDYSVLSQRSQFAARATWLANQIETLSEQMKFDAQRMIEHLRSQARGQ